MKREMRRYREQYREMLREMRRYRERDEEIQRDAEGDEEIQRDKERQREIQYRTHLDWQSCIIQERVSFTASTSWLSSSSSTFRSTWLCWLTPGC